MRFEAAWVWWLALPLLGYLWWLTRISYAQLTPVVRWGSFALRVAILLLVLAAISRPAWLKSSTQSQAVFLLDASRSISAANLDAALDEIDRLAKEALGDASTRVSVIAFGQSPTLVIRSAASWEGWPADVREKIRYDESTRILIEERTRKISAGVAAESEELKKLNERLAAVERFRDQVAGNFTDIEQALRLALNCGSTEQRRTVYLFSDGNFNRGQWQGAVAAAQSASTAVHFVALDKPAPAEVAIADIQAPASVRVDQGFSADIRLASTVETTAELRVFKDGFLHKEQQVTLKPGDNVVKVPGLFVKDKGFHAIEATIRPAADTQVANNKARAMVIAPGEARVLYVDRDVEQMPYLKSALELEGIQVEARSAAGVPQSLSELLSFDAFILCNVPADRLSLRQMQMIRTYVQDFGGGFMMIGGDESFGLGGYYNTPIEEILPVRMPIQKDMLRPSLALMLVIDKSGSMEGVKIQLAKRAAIATAEAINQRDLIGVIGFDAASRILLELTPAADRGTINSAISQLDAGGGTFLYPALEDAHERLGSSNARRKHVIVLSDGQTQGFGYEELVGSMAADSISLSAVGIGEGADMNLLESIASAGGGRAYFTNDFHTIPQIFTREALRASKSMLVERLLQPTVIAHDVALDEIDTEELPVITGYVATTPKSAANTLIVSDTGDPILAKWRYGLGRTAAFTSEPKPRWAEDWVEWDDFAKFWSQLVRSITGQDLTHTLHVECHHTIRGDDARLVADVRDAAGNYADNVELELTAVATGGKPRSLPVMHTGPGLYEAIFPGFRFGEDQQFVWRAKKSEPRSVSERGPQSEPRSVSERSTPAQEPLVRESLLAPTLAGIPSRDVSGTTSTATQPIATQPADEKEQVTSYGFSAAFPPEFATLGPSQDTIDQFRARGAGQVTSVGETKYAAATAAAKRWLTLWPPLLIAALLLVPLDILVRRLG
jgi:Ca-activated chloride channel family protein